jgi:RND family efflux transporter MFP subunit
MRTVFKYTGRFALTAVMVVLAAVVCWRLWVYYMDDPWTRDGRLRADVVAVALDVSGLVNEVLVHDNEQVQNGQVLFRIDPLHFELALRQAEATVENRRAAVEEAAREVARYDALTTLSVSREKQEQVTTAMEEASAAYQLALADRDTAKLNLDRSTVTAPVPGRITNFDLLPGNYATAGHAVTALVATETIRVEGYFEETKLERIHIGDPASIKLLGASDSLRGHVEGIADGIEDRERDQPTSDLLANVNPTFSWVRLAQRVPVRIHLDDVPSGTQLVAGRTATVTIERDSASSKDSVVALLLKAFG